ncbi:hypothetical protein [Actinocorallia populi]|uniref:hypothetical protein n=1 Tax=Actinocorallia populi TaxID=2079200 RepID=UPI000D08E9E7|nr:hypothetical protein [Actinocorallia populi]
MDAGQVTLLRELLSSTELMADTRRFARALRSSAREDLLLLGTPREEPWHLAAHLDEESRFVPRLKPTLVRWNPPPGAPAHLAVGLERLADARRGEALFVVAPESAPDPLLERVDDARRSGAVILTMDGGDRELTGLAHETLTVRSGGLVTFDQAQHLVSASAAEESPRRGLRERLARLLDAVSGPQVS